MSGRKNRSAGGSLTLLPDPAEYEADPAKDPIKYYYYPFLGKLYRRRVEMCLDFLEGGERVLEVGFGSGPTLLSLSEKYGEVWGLDLGANCEKVAGIFNARGVFPKLFNGSVLKMPFPDGHFDAALLVSILEHLHKHELPQAFAEIWRTLKPGGTVVYGVPVDRPMMTAAFRLMGHDISKEHFSTERDVAQAAGEKFELVEMKKLSSFFGLAGTIYEAALLRKPRG